MLKVMLLNSAQAHVTLSLHPVALLGGGGADEVGPSGGSWPLGGGVLEGDTGTLALPIALSLTKCH